MLTTEEKTEFSRGFDAGNYANAYESQNFEEWYDAHTMTFDCTPRYIEGMILGFWSSYELSEITDEVARADVEYLRQEYGQ
jgi:hypothetical protein